MIRTTTALALVASMMAAAPALADKMDLDTDNDGKVSRSEFRAGYDKDGAMFSSMDTDKDGKLSREEYNDSVYSRYDRDMDESINETEYKIYSEDHANVATRGQLPKPGDKEGIK